MVETMTLEYAFIFLAACIRLKFRQDLCCTHGRCALCHQTAHNIVILRRKAAYRTHAVGNQYESGNVRR